MVNQDKLEKFKLVFLSYSEVNNLDRYEDSKAERGLQALAFITLSGVTIFVGSLYILTLLDKGRNLLMFSYVLFGIFIFLISLGTLCILWAIKPRFNVPEGWKGGIPKSIFFYQKISEVPVKDWTDFFTNNTTDDLIQKATDDLVYETHLIAEKIGTKVRYSQWGFYLYISSIVVMIIMITSLVVLTLITT
jgi:hypothetical protein